MLAIIGVLSVGGIAGYSKAMMKYRINQTINQVSHLAQNIRNLYASQKNYINLNHEIIKKAKLAPDEMYENAETLALTNPFGGAVSIGSGHKMAGDDKAFIISFLSIPQEACIELLTHNFPQWIYVATASSAGALYGCQDATAQIHCSAAGDVSVNDAVSMCSNATGNLVKWKFY